MACGLPPDSQAAIACSVPETAGAAAASRLSWCLSRIRRACRWRSPRLLMPCIARSVGVVAAELAHGLGEPQVAAHQDAMPSVMQLSADGLAGDRGVQQRGAPASGRPPGRRARLQARPWQWSFGTSRCQSRPWARTHGKGVPVGFKGTSGRGEKEGTRLTGGTRLVQGDTLAEHVFA